MDNFKIWDYGSMAWTEIGLDESEYPKYADEIKETHSEWKQVNKILTLDVCGSFAFESGIFLLGFLLPFLLGFFVHEGFFGLFAISIFFITPMPDWGYDDDYLKERMHKWESRPRLVHFLNPIRIIGFPAALLLTINMRSRLKHEFTKYKIT